MRKNVRKLNVVNILNPEFCMHCRHGYAASVLMGDGSRKDVLYCTRRDCDNWRVEPEAATSIEALLFRGGDASREDRDPG